MRRPVLRIVLNAATVLSLVLCVATVAAWVRSYQAYDTLWWVGTNPSRILAIETYRGGLFASARKEVRTLRDFPRPGVRWQHARPLSYAESSGPEGSFVNRFGFCFFSFQDSETTMRVLASPYWFILLLTAILPGVRLVGWWRRARHLRMHTELCRNCGYDCRATPDRCPECGTPSTAG